MKWNDSLAMYPGVKYYNAKTPRSISYHTFSPLFCDCGGEQTGIHMILICALNPIIWKFENKDACNMHGHMSAKAMVQKREFNRSEGMYN